MLSLLALAGIATSEKPTAVMVHGAGGGGWEYKFWKPVFERANYRVVDLDLIPVNGSLERTRFSDYVSQIVTAAGPNPDTLIGASMGGVLVLKAAEQLKPKQIVLVCSTTPVGVGVPAEPKEYPPIIRWANGPYEDTLNSMPDSDEATRLFAHPRWRDESGAVLNEIAKGVAVQKPTCSVLSVIPEGDDSISPDRQQALASWAGADTLRFNGMSHVGPLLSTRATEVAESVLVWLKSRK